MRRSGRTTRLIDTCVQELFTSGRTMPMPHRFDGDGDGDSAYRREQNRMANIIIRRVKNEHGGLPLEITMEAGYMTIQLKSNDK